MINYNKLGKLLTETKPMSVKLTFANGVSIEMSYKVFHRVYK